MVVQGYQNKIAHIIQERGIQVAAGFVLGQIKRIIEGYGGKQPISDDVLHESVDFVLKKFYFLAVEELLQAYRMKAAGEIEPKGAEFYHGRFSIDALGKILTAYVTWRKAILGPYLAALEEEKQRISKQRRADQLKERFELVWPRLLREAPQKYDCWQDVPAFWYQTAFDRGQISFAPGEALAIYEEAKTLAFMELKAEAEGAKNVLEQRDILRSIENRQEERAKVIARKLTVWRQLIQPQKEEYRATSPNPTSAAQVQAAAEKMEGP